MCGCCCTMLGPTLFCACSGQARLVMRQRGNFRLLLNANLWPHMPVSMMDGNKVCWRDRAQLPVLHVHNSSPHLTTKHSSPSTVCLQGVNFACINHAKADDGEQSDCRAPQLASFAFRKKDVSKLEELLQIVQHETSSEACSADATSVV